MITICMTYFQSLALLNLEAALFSLRQQDFTDVKELLLLINDVTDDLRSVQDLADKLKFPIPFKVLFFQHGDPTRTHAWSTNMVVKHVTTKWIFFSRADYVLDFSILKKFRAVIYDHLEEWNGFVSSHVYHLHVDIGVCNQLPWRVDGARVLRQLPGVEDDYMYIDAGVWMARRKSFNQVEGLDENLSAWGHAQTYFQWRLYESGVEFITLPETLFYHPLHAASRDISVANQQLAARGIDLKKMWERYHGRNPYA